MAWPWGRCMSRRCPHATSATASTASPAVAQHSLPFAPARALGYNGPSRNVEACEARRRDPMPHTQCSADEVARRGEAIYGEQIGLRREGSWPGPPGP